MAKTRMKQLQWDKLSAEHASSTIWGRNASNELVLRDIVVQQGIFSEMDEEFKAKEASKRVISMKRDKNELQTYLNYATRQGIEMVLKRLKSQLTGGKQCTPEEVAHMLIQCDAQIFDQSVLTELLRYYPESETKGRLGEYKNATDEQLRLLHPADRLVVLLMTVPHLKDKVKGMLYMTRYNDTIDLIRHGLTKIREGSESIMNAPKFAQLLNLILLFGNYLNATGIKGGAYGFRISSINKLVDTKASDGTTLLHFVERTVSRCFPDLEGFVDELAGATEACRVQLFDLKHDLSELKTANNQHKKILDRLHSEQEENIEAPYSKIMLPFLNQATGELQRLTDQIQYTERMFDEALKFYGEGSDPIRRSFTGVKTMPTEEFFGIFKEFLAAYRKAKNDNAQLAQQRAMEAARLAAAEEREKERQEAMARRKAGVGDSAVLESLLSSLRSSGGASSRQRRKNRRRMRLPSSELAPSSDKEQADQNPSSLAAEMLKKLQGDEKLDPVGGAASSTAQAVEAARADRRRERLERNSVPVLQDIPRPPSAASRTPSFSDTQDTVPSVPTTPVETDHETKSMCQEHDDNDDETMNSAVTATCGFDSPPSSYSASSGDDAERPSTEPQTST